MVHEHKTPGVLDYSALGSSSKSPATSSHLFAVLGIVGIAFVALFWPRLWYVSPNIISQGADAQLNDTLMQAMMLALAGACAAIGPIRTRLASLFESLSSPSPVRRRRIALAIFLLSGPLLFGLGAARGRLMQPIWHDENMYRLQTTLLARGKFTEPALHNAEFFDAPYVFTHKVDSPNGQFRDVYAPVYFPGTALLHVPAEWLHLPYIITPLIIMAVTLTLFFLIIADLIDDLAGVLAVVAMVALHTTRWLSMVEMSHAAGVLWQLVAFYSWQRWRRGKSLRWAAMGGFAGGFYLITRPLDCLCLMLPLAIAWGWDLHVNRKWRVTVATTAVVIACALPMLVLQLAFDHAITGRFLDTPLDVYNRVYLNARSLGLQHVDPSFRPPTLSRQIHVVYDLYDIPHMRRHQSVGSIVNAWWTHRFPMTVCTALPSYLAFILIPISLLGLKDWPCKAMWIMSWSFLIGSAIFYIYVPQYSFAAAPSMVFAAVLGVAVCRQVVRSEVGRTFIPMGLFLLSCAYIAANYQGFLEPLPRKSVFTPGWVSRFNYVLLPKTVQKPAIILFRFDETEPAIEEPVYNWDKLNPDDCPIIRALDLGEKKDLELLRYYQQKQPDRHIYRFDRASMTLKDDGMVDQAIAKFSSMK